ncbi:hypothetical protein BCR26_02690 [Enterococcus rivorum]|uniref:Transport permease protein n=2 Tax=Enterococcus rivorum TaxID=762845 RepID=A0A1E5KX76_9ENTE|nr:hypothetical protein BCR26_02690 [Enterococcus rivorum]
MYRRYFPIGLFFNRILGTTYTIIGVWLIAVFLFEEEILYSKSSFIGDTTYFTYAVVGILFYSLAVATLMNVGRALITEVREGTLISLLLTPYNVLSYFFGVFVEQVWRTLLEFLILLIVSLFLGAELWHISVGNWLLGISFTLFVCFCMSIFLANIMLQMRDTYISQNTLFIFISFLCGITFPREILPSGLRVIGAFVPVTQSLEVFRILCFMPGNHSVLPKLIATGMVSASLYFLLGIVWYKKTERKIISYIFE